MEIISSRGIYEPYGVMFMSMLFIPVGVLLFIFLICCYWHVTDEKSRKSRSQRRRGLQLARTTAAIQQDLNSLVQNQMAVVPPPVPFLNPPPYGVICSTPHYYFPARAEEQVRYQITRPFPHSTAVSPIYYYNRLTW